MLLQQKQNKTKNARLGSQSQRKIWFICPLTELAMHVIKYLYILILGFSIIAH